MKYVVLILFLVALFSITSGYAKPIEYGEWYCLYDENGNKQIVGFSGSDQYTLTVYVDDQLITRLQFNPARKVTNATFDGKSYRGMNFNSLYGYDHWIVRMKRHYFLRIWFEGQKKPEIFPLKGFSRAVNWLQS